MQHLPSYNDTIVIFSFQTEAKPIIGPLATYVRLVIER